MKEFFLDSHSEHCSSNKKNSYFSNYCEENPERFLFFVGNNFVIITYYKCNSYYDKYDFKVVLIKNVLTNNKIFETWRVNKSVDLEKDLKNFRIRNQSLRKNIQQVNYIYSDNAGKQYAITTTANYLEFIANQDEIDKNYKDAKEFLIKNEYNWLIKELDNLYWNNRIVIRYEHEVEICRTIEHLTKSINQLIK